MDITANYAKSHTEPVIKTEVEKVSSILKWTYGLVPIAAGADKFTDLLTNWDKYLSSPIAGMLPFSTHTFMNIVGIIEIVAGILVLMRPRIGSLIVSLWLVGIAFNLLLTGQYFDIAVRDVVMAISAFSLWILCGRSKL